MEAAGALAEVDEVESHSHETYGKVAILRVLAAAAVATSLLSIGRKRQRRRRAMVVKTPAKKGGQGDDK